MAHTPTDDQIFHSEFSKNVALLESARKRVNSQINNFLRKEDEHSLKIYTNIYLLIYTSWSEASLIKLIHTPFGFSTEEKKRILKDKDVLNKWSKCVNTAFSKFRKSGSEIPNKKKKIGKLLKDYLKTQANIRNKIAHGQWVYPLFSNNLNHDLDAKVYIDSIDVIQIDTWFEVLKELIEIVRGLIDARDKNDNKAHYNEYFTRLTNIQIVLDQRSKWTLDEKKRKLKLKPNKK